VSKHSHDIGDSDEGEAVSVLVEDREPLRWTINAHVDKFDQAAVDAVKEKLGLGFREPTGDELLEWASAYESLDVPGNLLTTAGLNRITSLIIAGGGQAWDATHTRIGVGDSSTAANVADTDLGAAAGSSHRQFVVADSTYPQQSNGVITIRATFTTGLANFAWAEWCIDNGTGNGTTVTAAMCNHKITALGTKTSAASWVFTITITLS